MRLSINGKKGLNSKVTIPQIEVEYLWKFLVNIVELLKYQSKHVKNKTMGQYYKPVIINEDNQVLGWLYSHDHDNGLKLMEHSYVGNNFVAKFESLLIPGKEYHKSRVVWAGDYASYGGNTELNLYGLCETVEKVVSGLEVISSDEYPYVVNHTKKEYVDKRTMIKFSDGWQIHPLPLLTSEGNGSGGGDYHPNGNTKDDGKLVGSWARDIISVEPNLDGYEDYKQIKPKFKEDW
jgi:hypothetical protein